MRVAIAYYSKTGQTRRFIEKLSKELPDLAITEIDSGWEKLESPYVLITPTYKYGSVPEEVEDFLETPENAKNITAVISSGNTNWGRANYAMAGSKISESLRVPWLHKFEMQGNSKDLKRIAEEIIKINNKER